MILLMIEEDQELKPVAAFDTIENGRSFLKTIPGYKYNIESVEGVDYEYETIDRKQLPEYKEIKYKDIEFPINQWMFPDDTVNIYWTQVPNMDRDSGLSIGSTRVDAYMIDNDHVEQYIKRREEKYNWAKEILMNKGLKVERGYFGSQDGEAILYSDKEDEQKILCHIDPYFVEESPDNKEEFKKYIEDIL